MRKHLFVLLALCASAAGFTVLTGNGPDDPVPIPPSPQRKGNADAGFRYIVTGDYVNSGLPLSFYRLGFGKDKRNVLRRDGLNATVRPDFNVVKAPNGTTIAVPNCLQCHAQVFNDSLIVGLGNSLADFTPVRGFDSKLAAGVLETYMRTHRKKAEAAAEFVRVGKAIGGGIFTEVRGVNPADRLTALLISHRDRNTLAWHDSASTDLPRQVIPTDVPAWWLLKKKNAMFYNGFGRGDFGRFLMGAILLTVNDTAHANRVDSHMNDVLAFIQSIEPPPYPGKTDPALAAEGRLVFERSCAKCHGTYGEGGRYPNLLIPQQVIGTDSMINNSNYQYSDMVNWFNNSWFGQGDHPARLVPFNGFIAPPLDGVWITAPYLHNGSVPDIESLLNSAQRPRYWSRDFRKPAYDLGKLGWKYQVEEKPNGTRTYDTTLPGYGNQGHRFGDRLNDRERKAVIEYLKTL
jgi:mono/diheme cytochrome c family protein